MSKEIIKNRYDFVLLFDCTNGNPNGDPDFDNKPRTDFETGKGLVTDVCIKRKIRNYAQLDADIFIRNNTVLNNTMMDTLNEAFPELKLVDSEKETDELKNIPSEGKTKTMCDKFWDIRTFGGVLSTGLKCGQVTGAVQLGFAQSIDEISPMDLSITRMACTTKDELKKSKDGLAKTMGRKWIIPYGLYKMEGFINPLLAEKSFFTEDDLALFFESVINMFENDRSASKGVMNVCGLYVFKHESARGNARASQLFKKISVRKRDDVTYPRTFDDYVVEIDTDLPEGVELKNYI